MSPFSIIALVVIVFVILPGAGFAFVSKRKGLGWSLVGLCAAIVLLPWGALFHR